MISTVFNSIPLAKTASNNSLPIPHLEYHLANKQQSMQKDLNKCQMKKTNIFILKGKLKNQK